MSLNTRGVRCAKSDGPFWGVIYGRGQGPEGIPFGNGGHSFRGGEERRRLLQRDGP
jgi:hypothetical protein